MRITLAGTKHTGPLLPSWITKKSANLLTCCMGAGRLRPCSLGEESFWPTGAVRGWTVLAPMSSEKLHCRKSWVRGVKRRIDSISSTRERFCLCHGAGGDFCMSVFRGGGEFALRSQFRQGRAGRRFPWRKSLHSEEWSGQGEARGSRHPNRSAQRPAGLLASLEAQVAPKTRSWRETLLGYSPPRWSGLILGIPVWQTGSEARLGIGAGRA